MVRFYALAHDEASPWKGWFEAKHLWKMPGIHCPLCDAIWNTPAIAYPCVDLSDHPERPKLEKARLEKDFTEFERLRSTLRPLVPQGMPLDPGTTFGPVIGTLKGELGPIVLLQSDFHMLVRRETLELLQSSQVRGLRGCPTRLRSRRRREHELLEFQIEPHGLLHPDCIPPGHATPCPKCRRYGFSRPENPILDAASLPQHLDLFRLANFATILVATERFKEAVERQAPHCLSFRELPLR